MDRKRTIKIAVFFSLFNFFLISLLGLTFRLFPVFSFNGFHYQNWLQVHSHAAFLGWAYNALAVLLWCAFVPDDRRLNKRFSTIILTLQIPVFGMYFSFPTEGYGPWSIFFLSFHLVLFIYLMTLIIQNSKKKKSASFTLFKVSFWFMVLSAAGPMALGPISALGLKETHWYQAAIYFYLHFQYNGWFTIALLSLVLNMVEQSGVTAPGRESTLFGWIFTITTLLTYQLSLMGFFPEPVVYIPGASGLIIQIAAIYFIIRKFHQNKRAILSHRPHIYPLALLVTSFLAFKLMSQLLTAIPAVVEFAYIRRDLVIAYLHLSLLGFISTGLLLFYGWKSWLNFKTPIVLTGLITFLTGFIITELLLGIRGFFPEAAGNYALLMIYMLIIHAVIMAVGIFIMMLAPLVNFNKAKA